MGTGRGVAYEPVMAGSKAGPVEGQTKGLSPAEVELRNRRDRHAHCDRCRCSGSFVRVDMCWCRQGLGSTLCHTSVWEASHRTHNPTIREETVQTIWRMCVCARCIQYCRRLMCVRVITHVCQSKHRGERVRERVWEVSRRGKELARTCGPTGKLLRTA